MDESKSSRTHLASLLGGILFSLGGLFLMSVGLFMGFTAFFSSFNGRAVQAQQTIFFVAFSFEAMLLFVAAFFSFQKHLGRPAAEQASSLSARRWQIVAAVLIAAFSILLGYAVGPNKSINWLFLPLLTIPAVVLPLAVLLALGTRGLPMGPRWQSWSVLGLGMTLTPLLLLILESVVAILGLVGVVAYVMTQPELVSELEALSQQIIVLGPQQSEKAIELLSPLLTRPSVILTALIYMAFLVPAIEELLKPLGVWLLARRLASPAQGFALGALSGTGYALIETVGVSGQTAEWASLLFSRIGTGLLHITTSALVGAAIVLAWRERRYLHLIGTYVLAVLLHGLWNAFALLFTFSNLASLLEQPGHLSTLQPIFLGVMGILTLALFLILLVSNRRMQNGTAPPPADRLLPAEPMNPAP